MRWRRFVFWSVFGLFALLVLAVLWLWTADLGIFKPQLEKWVTEKTGREFAIDGTFSVDLARHSVVIAEGVRFANAEWAGRDQMIEIGRLEARVDLWSIFSGPTVVESIHINDAEIHLAQPHDGDPNWQLPLETREESRQAEDDERGFPLLFEFIDLDRARLVYESPERARPLDVHIVHLGQEHRGDDFLELSLQATLNDREVRLSGKVGTWRALLDGSDIRYELEGRLDTLEVQSDGSIDDLSDLRRPSMRFAARGPDIDDLSRLLALGEDGVGDIDLSGSLTPKEDGPLVLDVRGNIGQTEIQASGAFSDLQELERIDIDLLASGPDLGRILRLAGIHQIREAPFKVRLDAERQGPMFVINQGDILFGEAQLDLTARMPKFPSVDDAKISLHAKGAHIERLLHTFNLPGVATGEFSLGLTVEVTDAGVETLRADVITSLGQITVRGPLGEPPDYLGSEMQFELKSDSFAGLARAYGFKNLPETPIEIAGRAQLATDGVRTRGPLVLRTKHLTVNADGLIVLSPGIVGSDLSLELDGPDLSALVGVFANTSWIPVEPYDINGRLQVRDDGFRFRELSGTVGSSAVDVDGLLTAKEKLAGTHFTFEATGPAFEEVIDSIGDLEVRPGPYRVSGTLKLESDLLDLADIDLDREYGDASFDLELGLPVSRRWANFDVRARGPDVRSVLGGIANFDANEAPFSVDARGELRDTSVVFDKFDVSIGDARMQARGGLEFAKDAQSTQFVFSGNIPSMTRFGTYNNHVIRDQSVTWNAKVTGNDGTLRIDDLDVKLGDSDIDGSVLYRAGDIPQLNVDISSESIAFAPLLEAPGSEGEPEPEPDSEPESDKRLIPEVTIPFDGMRRLNASINLDIGELQRDALYLRDIVLDVALQDGVLRLNNVGFGAHTGYLKARAHVEPANGLGKASIELVARDFTLALLEKDPDIAMAGNMDVNMESTGNDLRTLLGNANGIVFLNTRGGRMPNNRFIQAVYGDALQEILSVINPFYKADPYTDFDCIVVPWEIADGKVKGKPESFVRTDKLNLVSKSEIDLKTEEIVINVRTRPRKGLTISTAELINPYIQIVGTLASPRLAVDAQGAIISGGAAVATGGLSILAKAAWDRLIKTKNPCDKTAEEAIKDIGDRFPDFDTADVDTAQTE